MDIISDSKLDMLTNNFVSYNYIHNNPTLQVRNMGESIVMALAELKERREKDKQNLIKLGE